MKNDHGAAFPLIVEGSQYQVWEGMSLRDYFAGQALTGIALHGGIDNEKHIAAQAYRYADAMLAEREKEQ